MGEHDRPAAEPGGVPQRYLLRPDGDGAPDILVPLEGLVAGDNDFPAP